MTDRQLSERQGKTEVSVPRALADGQSGLTPEGAIRLGRLGRELRLTDQILSVDLDTVRIVDSGPAPAWTTLEGDEVSFALSRMPLPDSRVNVAVWLGTNAHELGHVLFSPRRGSILMQRIMAADTMHLRGIADLHNIVEDQRQERLLLGRFAPWRACLTAALGHHLFVKDEAAWVLLAGRTWLPDTVRADAKARFAVVYGASSADQVAEIVGDYQRLTDPGDTESDEAWNLLIRLHDLFGTNIPHPPNTCTVMTGGEPDTGEPGESLPPAADEQPDGDGAAAGGEGTEKGESTADGGDTEDSDQSAAGPAAGAGKGQVPPIEPPLDRMRRQLTEAAVDQIAADAETVSDLDSILDALRAGRSGAGADGDDPQGTYLPATDAARRLHHEVGNALLDLKDECEPGWLRRVDSGRLNVRRLADPHVDPEALFDRYDPGALDASQIELVLLLDVSGSMWREMHNLAEATWAIRQAVDDIEGAATVITWDDQRHRIVAAVGDRPDDRMFVPDVGGGTHPLSALSEAFRLLSDSEARNRLMIVMTDGDWWMPERAEGIIAAMNATGITTVCAHLNATTHASFHGCTHGGRIDNLAELARLFQRVAIEQIGAGR